MLSKDLTLGRQQRRMILQASDATMPNMKIEVNGLTREVTEAVTLIEVLQAEGLAGRRVAVEVNRELVPRSMHGSHALREGDRIEIVHAMGGG